MATCECANLDWSSVNQSLQHHPDCKASVPFYEPLDTDEATTFKVTDEPLQSEAGYLLCFRVVAWKAAVFAEERWKLGPKYHCPLCTLPEKDLPKGCPECPLTSLFIDVYKDAALYEIKERGGLADGVTLDALMNDYAKVARVLADNRSRINPKWDMGFVELARIVLQEQNHQIYVSRWNTWKKMKATSK